MAQLFVRTGSNKFKHGRVLRHPRSFRILVLHPAHKESDELSCQLKEAMLPLSYSISTLKSKAKLEGAEGGDFPAYEALSYTWGSDTESYDLHIRVDGKLRWFKISKTLEQALRGLRYEEEDRYLWVDQVCINQDNPIEKNAQVPNMDRIYTNAQRAVIWLGNSNESTKGVIKFMREKLLNLWGVDAICHDTESSRDWTEFIKLAIRPWFTRRWVIQEIALAPEAVVYIGREHIDWREFADAIGLFVRLESETHKLSEIVKFNPSFRQIRNFFGDMPSLGAARLVEATGNIFRISDDGRYRERLQSLEYLMSIFSVFNASDPKDIVFALLALAKDTTPHSELEDSIQEALSTADAGKYREFKQTKLYQKVIKWAQYKTSADKYTVDYNMGIVEIYKNFVSFCISRSDKLRALDILCRPWAPVLERSGQGFKVVADDDYDDEGVKDDLDSESQRILPSWCASLRKEPFARKEHPHEDLPWRMERKNADILVGLPGFGMSTHGQRIYSACGSKAFDQGSMKFRRCDDDGYSFFAKGFILDWVIASDIGAVAEFGNLPSEWLHRFSGSKRKRDTLKTLSDNFWRTLVVNRSGKGENPPQLWRRTCAEAIIKGWGRENPTQSLIHERRSPVIEEFLRRAEAVIWGRRMVKTAQNHLGLVPRNFKADDKICILYGCSVPVILRKHNKSYDSILKEQEEDAEDFKKKVELIKPLLKRLVERFRRKKPMSQFSPKILDNFGSDSTIDIDAMPITREDSTSVKRTNTHLSEDSILIPKKKRKLSSTQAVAVETPQNFQEPPQRTFEHYWTLIGECYIHGMMDGEAIIHRNDTRTRATLDKLSLLPFQEVDFEIR